MPQPTPLPRPNLLRWPLPALLAWAAGWLSAAGLVRLAGWPAGAALAAGLAVSALPAVFAGTRWRRLIVAGGYPLSLLALGAGGALPGWAWLLPLALILLLYPTGAWRDAPLFPTPSDALAGLPHELALPAGARLLDAGSGLGDGLRALRRAWPAAQVGGVERSVPLAWLSRLRCPWAQVQRGDMWQAAWGRWDLVYLFQRPESMARAWHKACAEMAPGSWLVSLEFEVPGQAPAFAWPLGADRMVRAYRIGPAGPGAPGPQESSRPALKLERAESISTQDA